LENKAKVPAKYVRLSFLLMTPSWLL